MTDGVKDNGLSLKGQTLTFRPLNNPPFLLVFLVLFFYENQWPLISFILLPLAPFFNCRIPVPAHPLHTARSTWDHLDCAEEVWLWRWPGAHTGILVPNVSADLTIVCSICVFYYVILTVRWSHERDGYLNRTFVLFDGLMIRVSKQSFSVLAQGDVFILVVWFKQLSKNQTYSVLLWETRKKRRK